MKSCGICRGIIRVVFLATVAANGAGCSGEGDPSSAPVESKRVAVPPLEEWDVGFCSLMKPRGWDVFPAGYCSTLAVLARDPSEPLRQVFVFGLVGPFYLSEEQKAIDTQYVSMGGFPNPWMEMPVVSPLTPRAFLETFPAILRTQTARQFMPRMSPIGQVETIGVWPVPSALGEQGQAALMRAVFRQDDKAGEGLFVVTVAPFTPFTGGPGGGTGCAFQFCGVCAPRGEFAAWQETLIRCLASFQVSPAYAQDCMRQQADAYGAITRAGETQRETADLIMKGWESRNRSDDIVAAKRSDAILDVERLYDASSGQVYEFDNGFYDRYKLDPNQYRLDNLEPLPADRHDLWTAPVLDGRRHL